MSDRLIPTGGEGLDEILRGSPPRGSIHLVQAPAGAGKTTLALQFLLEGVRHGEPGLHVTLSQTTGELHRIARSHGWSLDRVEIVELQSAEDASATDQTIFQTADLRLDRTRQAVEAAVERVRPGRMVYDSLLEVRLPSRDVSRFHRELIGLRAFTDPRGITVMPLDMDGGGEPATDDQARGIVHGILTMSKTLPAFGRARRRIEITKMRGVDIHDGWHDMDIRSGQGVVVFPRVVPSAGRSEKRPPVHGPGAKPLVRSGVARLDELLGGGLEPGTTTLVVGQAGTGKSTVASLYAAAALARGERVALFLFEERLETFFRRCEGLGMQPREHVEGGQLTVFDYSPDEVSPGEFSQIVQAQAEGLGMVVIDSLTGYMASLADEAQALFDIQALMKFLARREILTIMIVARRGLLGADEGGARLDLSFLGDTVLLLRMQEEGRVLRSIMAVKKRHGPHELDVRELSIRSGEIRVGDARPGL